MDHVRVAMSQGRLEIEGPRPFVLEQLERLLPRVGLRALEPAGYDGKTSESRGAGLTQFMARRRLRNRYEQIAAVLLYAETVDGKPELSVQQISDYLENAGFGVPKAPAQAVADAKRWKRYVESPRRGAWRLTKVGRQIATATSS
jgi:hypothetical protein